MAHRLVKNSGSQVVPAPDPPPAVVVTQTPFPPFDVSGIPAPASLTARNYTALASSAFVVPAPGQPARGTSSDVRSLYPPAVGGTDGSTGTGTLIVPMPPVGNRLRYAIVRVNPDGTQKVLEIVISG